ncbi:hypothetical protein BIT28_16135 [Photobacterium proteolyticum]|uniref:Uncharacterized protein n=1 Tax=Photobacterium proteolyticum TaxID=1903952 RepID=A0A1Q9H1R8_9GAMM|nr:hypothetical protein BIT28_16135 [Photobacterium proteolyticum]
MLGESDKLSWACNVLAASAVVRSRKIELNGLGRSNRKTKGACSANLTAGLDLIGRGKFNKKIKRTKNTRQFRCKMKLCVYALHINICALFFAAYFRRYTL